MKVILLFLFIDGKIHFFHRSNPHFSIEMKAHSASVNTLEWKGGLLASGSDDRTIKIWNCSECVPLIF